MKDGKRYVFEWNYSRIPDPKLLVESFEQSGIHLAANIKPCLLLSHPRYQELAKIGAFVKANKGPDSPPEVNMFWGGEGSHLDFTNPIAFDWWKSKVKEVILKNGIHSTWNDNNEYEIWNSNAICHGFPNSSIELLRPIQTMLMVKSSFEAQKEMNPNIRPYLITRSASPGNKLPTSNPFNLFRTPTIRTNMVR